MFSATKNLNESNTGKDSMMEFVYGIIDSKFQFVKHRTNSLIEKQLEDQAITIPDNIDGGDIMAKIGGVGHDASILQHIEDYSKTTRMLLFLRNYLSPANANIIFDLLTDDIYLNFSEKELKIVIDGQNQKEAGVA